MKITIFGLAGTGTSTVGRLLAKKLNYDFKSSGEMFRKIASSHNQTIYEFEKTCKNDNKFDLEVDNAVVKYGKNNIDFVFESRLAYYFISDSFKIKLICGNDECYKRIAQREEISFEEAKEKTIFRTNESQLRYNLTYSQIQYPPKDKVFDIIIDTTNISPEKIVEKIIKELNK